MQTRILLGSCVCTNSLFSFSITVKQNFLGTLWTRLIYWLLEMGQIIPLSKSFTILARTTSYIIGFNLGFIFGFVSSLRWMLCWTIAGLSPLMSVMLQPMTSLCFLRTDIRLSSCLAVKWDVIMIGMVSCPPWYMYLRYLGKTFSYRQGDDLMEGWVKFVGSRFREIWLDAQFIAESTILSRLNSSDSNSNSHLTSNSISSLCLLVKFSMRFT